MVSCRVRTPVKIEMKVHPVISGVVAAIGTALFTVLLCLARLSQTTYAVLLSLLALTCIAILCLPRLLELDVKNLRLVLGELKQVKAEIEQIYGGIENIKKGQFVLDESKMKEIGLGRGGVPLTGAVVRYVAGCIRRERERLARIFVVPKSPEKLAEAIMDSSLDEKVFKWAGPESPLDKPPKSLDEHPNKKRGQTPTQ